MQSKTGTGEHIQGNSAAALTLVEYGDYQCSSCGESYLTVKDIQQQLGNRLKFVFRNFPLTDIHPDAFSAAMAAEAAARQYKFWEMHDLLFTHQEYLSAADLFDYANDLGLDMDRFGRDVRSELLASKINREIDDGINRGVAGTPTFFVNGEKFADNWANGDLARYLSSLAR